MRRGRSFLVVTALVACLSGCLVTSASGLAENRAYEMVSPTYKGGYGATNIIAVGPTGEDIAFYSPGEFAEAPSGLSPIDYFAHREGNGWMTLAEMPPSELVPLSLNQDTSSTLDRLLDLGKPGPNFEAAGHESSEEDILFHEPLLADISANWKSSQPILTQLDGGNIEEIAYEGGNADICRILLSNVGEKPLLAEAEGTINQLYEANLGCMGEAPALKLVALNEENKPISPRCLVTPGVSGDNSSAGTPSAYNAISEDGETIFFTTCVAGNATDRQLFVRLGGSTTLEISKPPTEEESCVKVVLCQKAASRASAEFVGASEDGSRVYFKTNASLVSEDRDASEDLYMATIGCSDNDVGCPPSQRVVTSLAQVSKTQAPNEAAEVQGVLRVSPDGSHVYFVARGILSTEPDSQNATAVKGADNLYSYNAELRQVRFVGDLCSGRQVSGTTEDTDCPNTNGSDLSLWSGSEVSEAQTAGNDGRFLVFSTYARMTPNDSDAAKDVYRYDADIGKLNRVSLGESGYEANGNNEIERESVINNSAIQVGHKGGEVRFQYEMDNRAISEDGSRILFSSAQALSPKATNHLSNLYVWHEGSGSSEGEVSLISNGGASEPVGNARGDDAMSSSGNDVFFVTTQGLVPQDTDGAPDVYDARVGGGFPTEPASNEPCSSDSCQGPLTNPAALLVPGSVSQAPGEDSIVSPPKGKTKSKPNAKSLATKRNRALKACRRKRGQVRKKCERVVTRRYSAVTVRKSTVHKAGR